MKILFLIIAVLSFPIIGITAPVVAMEQVNAACITGKFIFPDVPSGRYELSAGLRVMSSLSGYSTEEKRIITRCTRIPPTRSGNIITFHFPLLFGRKPSFSYRVAIVGSTPHACWRFVEYLIPSNNFTTDVSSLYKARNSTSNGCE